MNTLCSHCGMKITYYRLSAMYFFPPLHHHTLQQNFSHSQELKVPMLTHMEGLHVFPVTAQGSSRYNSHRCISTVPNIKVPLRSSYLLSTHIIIIIIIIKSYFSIDCSLHISTLNTEAVVSFPIFIYLFFLKLRRTILRYFKDCNNGRLCCNVLKCY